MNLKQTLDQELNKIKSQNLYRQLRIISSNNGRYIFSDEKRYLNLSSNNYLGLATHPAIKKAAQDAIEKYGNGGTSSRLIAGTFDIHKNLEEELAYFQGAESCLVYPSGYQANIGVISALVNEGDCVIMDRLNHASLWDAAKMSRARIFIYAHNDINFLEKILVRTKTYRKRLIVTDSVFSMDGDFANLNDIVFLAEKYDAWTMVDEAHAIGIFGDKGSGLIESFGLEKKVDITIGTLSKALGSNGGFVCGSKELIDYLINKSRSFIFSTAISPVNTASALESLKIIRDEPNRRETLLNNSKILKDKLELMGFNTLNSQSQIVPVLTSSIARTLETAEYLFSKGIYAPAIRPPTVPQEQCRIRFSFTTEHNHEDIDKLILVLKNSKSKGRSQLDRLTI